MLRQSAYRSKLHGPACGGRLRVRKRLRASLDLSRPRPTSASPPAAAEPRRLRRQASPSGACGSPPPRADALPAACSFSPPRGSSAVHNGRGLAAGVRLRPPSADLVYDVRRGTAARVYDPVRHLEDLRRFSSTTVLVESSIWRTYAGTHPSRRRRAGFLPTSGGSANFSEVCVIIASAADYYASCSTSPPLWLDSASFRSPSTVRAALRAPRALSTHAG